MQTEKRSVCPLDCPDTCSLSVTVADDRAVGVRQGGPEFPQNVTPTREYQNAPLYPNGEASMY
jgi:hypothetical protein